MRHVHWRITITVLIALVALTVATTALGAPPANDNFANAQAVAGVSGSLDGFNFDAAKEAGEPEHAGVPGGPSVWYRWIAPADGQVAFGAYPQRYPGGRGDPRGPR